MTGSCGCSAPDSDAVGTADGYVYATAILYDDASVSGPYAQIVAVEGVYSRGIDRHDVREVRFTFVVDSCNGIFGRLFRCERL